MHKKSVNMPETDLQWSIDPLRKDHRKTDFASGQIPLDSYLLRQATQDVRRRLTRVFVLCQLDSLEIAGFYTLSAATIQAAKMPPALARKLPRYPLPAVLIGRLAVDHKFQGQGLGKIMMADALKRILLASATIAVHAVLVDAKDEQSGKFYKQFGFQAFTKEPLRLFLPLATLLKIENS